MTNNNQTPLSGLNGAQRLPSPDNAEGVDHTRGNKPKILLLDDEERILKSLNAILRFRYQVLATTDGYQALEAIQRERPHVVVSDQRMPRMSGVEFLRQAKTLSPNTVRLLLTGYSDLTAIIGSINEGEVYRYISKPWSNQEIQVIVAEAAAIGVELARETNSIESAPIAMEEHGVLILDENVGAATQVIESLNNTYKIHHAKDFSDMFRTLATHRIGVIVADLKSGNRETEVFFRLLKREYPQILTIVIDDYSDSAKAIELINKAKIYRYLVKPVKTKMLQHYVGSAMEQFRANQARPSLLRQQTPQECREDGRSAFGQNILTHLRSLRNRFRMSVSQAETPK
jgi:DNA-binding NtrC family response regulator